MNMINMVQKKEDSIALDSMGFSKERIPISNKERNNKSSVKNNFQQTELLNPTYKGVMAKR